MIMEPLSVGAFLRVPPCLSGEIEPASGKYLFFKISRKRSKENILKNWLKPEKIKEGKMGGIYWFSLFQYILRKWKWWQNGKGMKGEGIGASDTRVTSIYLLPILNHWPPLTSWSDVIFFLQGIFLSAKYIMLFGTFRILAFSRGDDWWWQ